jgi:hypothetical protein
MTARFAVGVAIYAVAASLLVAAVAGWSCAQVRGQDWWIVGYVGAANGVVAFPFALFALWRRQLPYLGGACLVVCSAAAAAAAGSSGEWAVAWAASWFVFLVSVVVVRLFSER